MYFSHFLWSSAHGSDADKGRHRLEEKKAACVLCLVIFQALNVLL